MLNGRYWFAQQNLATFFPSRIFFWVWSSALQNGSLPKWGGGATCSFSLARLRLGMYFATCTWISQLLTILAPNSSPNTMRFVYSSITNMMLQKNSLISTMQLFPARPPTLKPPCSQIPRISASKPHLAEPHQPAYPLFLLEPALIS